MAYKFTSSTFTNPSSQLHVGDIITPLFMNGTYSTGLNGTPVEPGDVSIKGPNPGTETAQYTIQADSNNGQLVAGSAETAANPNYLSGFIFNEVTGNYTQVDVPGSTATSIEGIDNSGRITGWYTDKAGANHDFIGTMDQYPDTGTQLPGQGGIDSGGPNISVFGADANNKQYFIDDAATPYSGPVAGLTSEYIDITPDNLNISSSIPNVFIHSGSGTDGIDLSNVGGNNVIDGGTGSNFLSGNSLYGNDTFFVDDRNASSDIWSTIANFHAGDSATIFGVTAADFNIAYADNQGATGYQGLTVHATNGSNPQASLTLAGFSQTDIASGKLSVSFGRTTDLPGLPGSTYMQVLGH